MEQTSNWALGQKGQWKAQARADSAESLQEERGRPYLSILLLDTK